MISSEKNVWMFVCGCLFYQQIDLQHQLNWCCPEYYCEHAPTLELRYVFTRFRVALQSFLLHLFTASILWHIFLIMLLIKIVSLSLCLNKRGSNFDCSDANLLMPMSSLLISNKKALSCNWLGTNNNFWCCQEFKMWISGALFEQIRFSFDNLTHVIFWTKVKEVSPQIAISESPKSGWEKLIFSSFTKKQLEIYDRTKSRLNPLLHQLLVGIIRSTKAELKKALLIKISNAFFSSASVLLNFLMYWLSNVA